MQGLVITKVKVSSCYRKRRVVPAARPDTESMHVGAELGIAAHWKYKGGNGGKDEQKFDWLRQLMERQGELDNPHEFLDVVKVDLFPDEVFVFTPRGDVISLPEGAVALDFAYAAGTLGATTWQPG